ncbi:bacterial nucleoid DNA-binding protein [Actinobacteria bacterium IMCC26256]|jgi:DNA-binding protein HU-beta|nr:bacterial nucleoid DNA-binding protein [Actinobacteria bacterium IMCC26256]
MNKAELVDKVAEATGMPKKDVEEVLGGVINAVVAAVKADDKVALPGFGSFTKSHRAARQGRNPQTGATIEIAASNGVKFSAAAGFKSAVN